MINAKEDSVSESGEGLSSLLSELKSGNVKRRSIKREQNKLQAFDSSDVNTVASSVEVNTKSKFSYGIKLPFLSPDQIKLKTVKKV